MYNGELEVQAKRKTLAVLHDEITHILNAARDLSSLTDSLIKGTSKETEMSIDRMKNAGEEVDTGSHRNLGRATAGGKSVGSGIIGGSA